MNVSIIGAGKLGKTLIRFFSSRKQLDWVLIRNSGTRASISEFIDPEVKIISDFRNLNLNSELSDYIILAVPDSIIPEVSEILASFYQNKLSGKAVIHCAGQLSRKVMSSLSNLGARVAACHPFQTFYFPEIQNLRDVPWGIDCLDEDLKIFEDFVFSTGGFPVRLSPEVNKTLYHASAVAASNFTAATLSLAKKIAIESGIDPKIFLPLIIKTTIGNILRSLSDPSDFTITGPYVRGDFTTIENHLAALDSTPELKQAYDHMNQALASLSEIK